MSLDVHEPDAAVFTCEAAEQGAYAQRGGGSAQQGGYMQQASYAQQSGYALQAQAQQAQAQQGQAQLPYPWVQLADQNGAPYYSNPLTGEASWDPPQ